MSHDMTDSKGVGVGTSNKRTNASMSTSGLSILQAYESDLSSEDSADEGEANDVICNNNSLCIPSCSCSSEPRNQFLKSIYSNDCKSDASVPCKRPRMLDKDYHNGSCDEEETTKADNSVPVLKSRPSEGRLSLPGVPSNILEMFPDSRNDQPENDPSQHEGRKRSFPHIRGNWASYIYIHCTEESTIIMELNKLVCDLGKSLMQDQSIHIINDKHLSLSRTLSFRHHWIEPFTSNLKKAISYYQCFDLCLDEFEVYTNDEKTRTFLGMKVMDTMHLLDIVTNCDESLSEFQLEPYYEDPSFHISCAWMLGDQSAWAKANLIPILNKKWNQLLEKDPALRFYPVSTVEFKTGNQQYRFFLQKNN